MLVCVCWHVGVVVGCLVKKDDSERSPYGFHGSCHEDGWFYGRASQFTRETFVKFLSKPRFCNQADSTRSKMDFLKILVGVFFAIRTNMLFFNCRRHCFCNSEGNQEKAHDESWFVRHLQNDPPWIWTVLGSFSGRFKVVVIKTWSNYG